jgi:hypothetical protein
VVAVARHRLLDRKASACSSTASIPCREPPMESSAPLDDMPEGNYLVEVMADGAWTLP